MKEKESSIRRYADLLWFGVLFCAVGYIALRYLLPILFPFLFAWGLCFLLRPVAEYLNAKLRIPRGVARVVLVLSVYLLSGVGVYLLISRLLSELSEFLRFATENPEFLNDLFSWVKGIFAAFGGSGEALFSAMLSYLGKAVGVFLPNLLLSAFTALPRFLFAVAIGVIASVYFSSDFDRINEGVRAALPKRLEVLLLKIKDGILFTVLGYLRAYSLIFILVLAALLIGFCILRMPYALLLSFSIALLDILPLFGVGTALLPLAIYAFATGDTVRGAGLLILYGVIFIGREWAEPHIIGRRFGIHPVLSLLFLYLGTKFFGFAGLLLAPLFAVTFKSLFVKQKDAANIKERAVKKRDDPTS